MSGQPGKLEITLSAFDIRGSHMTGEILTSGVENFFKIPSPLYQATLNGDTFISYVRELLALEAIRRLEANGAKALHVKVDSAFLTPDVEFSRRNVLPRIQLIFDTYGTAYNVPVTYEGFDPFMKEKNRVGI